MLAVLKFAKNVNYGTHCSPFSQVIFCRLYLLGGQKHQFLSGFFGSSLLILEVESRKIMPPYTGRSNVGDIESITS